ncbi:non-ribosomal peptide synthetase [Acuticoccus sp. I52.16.1]|uniref:non-ribosomal peptide synthetase n=1 Tax=Acuticoccus sp. I52.16.1 TaxID=2928472 RepID=UPI001FD3429D|nr:non-ribosomal peptide synthetase [Acuticoccus sp. I52.16.1]UOM34327.1 amino acid adenylation domain-containing protein [Acuticoccus sp. I52.16.1]
MPASFAQERLWFEQSLAPDSPHYNEAVVLRVRGALDVARMAAAFGEVVRRHEILRTRFVATEAGLTQVVEPPQPVTILAEDAAGTTAEAREAHARAIVREAIRTPFALDGAPLLRLRLVRTEPQAALLALVVHHVVLDGWSAVLVFREAFTVYGAMAEGREAALPALPLQYADFAADERAALANGALDADRSYWAERLAGDLPLPPLPYGRRPRTVASGRGGHARLTIAADLAGRLRTFARGENATLFTTMGAALALLLARHAGQEEVLIAAPMTVRDGPDLAPVAGLFINTVLLRLDVAPQSTFRDLVRHAQARVLEAQSHHRYPFQALMADLRGAGTVTGRPLASVMFDLQRLPEAMEPAGLSVDYVEIDPGTSKFDLGLSVKETEGPLLGTFEYAGDLFTDTEIAWFAERYRTLLDRLVSAPDRPLADLSIADTADVAAIAAWNDTARPVDLAPLDAAFAQALARSPHAPAVHHAGTRLTFAELDAKAGALAGRLAARGVVAGEGVAMVLPRGVDQIAAILACWRLGAAYVALDTGWPRSRIAAAVAAVAGRLVLTDGDTDALVEGATLRVDRDEPAAAGVAARATLDDPAYMMFTSGSSGTPRLVSVTHRNLAHLAGALAMRLEAPARRTWRVAVNGPLSFDTSVKQLVQLTAGHTLDIVPDGVRTDPPAFVAWLGERRIDVLDATPLHVAALMDAGLAEVATLQRVLVGGEAIDPALWEALARAPFRAFNMYGPTETTVDATVAEITGGEPVIGAPLANVTAHVVDAALRPVPVGVVGELMIGGAGVAAGYVGDAAATADRFIEHDGVRVYRTGDGVRWRLDGTLAFAGRIDDQVKLRGHRIEPGEIVAALRAVPGVEDAAVVTLGEGEARRLVAYVVAAARAEPPARRLPNGLMVAELNRNETDFLYEEMFEQNAYFKHGIGLPAGATVLDVGANIGLFSLAAHFAAPGVTIHAFEPNPAVADLAAANTARYGARARVHRHAIAATAGAAEFTFYPGFSILSGLYADAADDRAVVESFVRKHDGADYEAHGLGTLLGELLDDRFRAETLSVPLETLSAVIAREGLERVDLLKINVEKAEADVLAGLSEADWPKVAQVAVEVHDLDGRLARVVALLEGRGFAVTVERDWQLEDDAGTNFYVYARRPGLAPHAPPGPVAALVAGPAGPLDPGPLDPDLLLAALRTRLPEVMVPSEVILLDRLPTTANGKLDRRALPVPAARATDRRPPATPTEARLASLWAELLNRPVGCEENFFALGGHSLLATRLIARIRADFAVALPIRTLFEAPTVARLAREVDAAEAAAPAAAATVIHAAAARHEPFALTDIQEAYWLGRNAAFDLGNTSTRIYLELEDRDWDVARLEEGWNRLVVRHDMLRAVVDDDGRQRVLPEVPRYGFDTHDLTDAADPEADLAARRARMIDAVMPFDTWPLFEIGASRLAGGAVRLHISMDALIADATSLLVLFREWAEFMARGAFAAPAPAITFRDYVTAVRGAGDAAARAAAEAYWLSRLEDLPAAPQLPLAKNPATVATPTFRRRTHLVAAPAWAGLRRAAGEAGVSVSAALLAAFGEVLARWSDDPRLTVNLTTFDRTPLHDDVARLVGDFTTLTLVAVDCAETLPFADRARAVQRRLWSDLDHRAFGGVDVLRALAQSRKSGTAAQMPVVFTSVLDLEEGAAPTRFGDLVTSVAQTPQVWLDHQVMEWNGALVLNWDAVEEIFPAGLLDAMFAAYAGLVERLAQTPAAWAAPVGPLVPAAQLAARAAANATAAPLPVQRLEAGFLARAAEAPERTALIDGERTMTYGELAARSAEIAARLVAAGAGPGRLVAVLARKGWEQVAAVLGVLRAGAAYLPVDPDLPGERIAYLLAHGDVDLALTQSTLAVAWPGGVTRIAVDRLRGTGASPPAPDNVDDLAYVIFTSGSTGLPKGVMLDHRAAWNTLADINARWRVGPEDRVLALSALGFDLSVYDIFGVLGAGGALVLPAPEIARDPAAWAHLAQRHRVTLWNSVPALMQMLVETAEMDPASWPASLRLVLLSGDWIPVTLPGRIRALGEAAVVSLGGATEAAVWSIAHPADDVDPARAGIPYGKPLANQVFHVLGRDMAPVPDYVAGELYIGGAGLAQGYWKDAEKTAASFVIHPATGERLYRTGDFGRYVEGGVIEFLGRRDAQVKVSGYRIELGEIEAALAAHPDVAAAAVSAPADRAGHRRLVAHVVMAPAVPDDFGDLAEGVLTDPLARMDFQMRRLGQRPTGTGETVVALPGGAVDATRRAAFLARQSHRRFLDTPVPLAAFGALLASLQGIEIDGAPLPKFRYPSASSLNPVQCYVAVKAGMAEGLDGGLYYLDPVRHALVHLGAGDVAGVFPGASRALHEAAAFAVFLVGRLDAIRPLYGGLARDFALLEAGYAGQALMDAAPREDIGLCPIGHVDEAALTARLGVEGEVVVHGFVGGVVDPAWAAQWGRAHPAPADPAEAMKAWARRKLPAYMVPATFVFRDALPLTANGKVDRGALAVPAPAAPAAPVATGAAGGAVEAAIAAVMAEILEQPSVAPEANFFDLGANSLHLVQLHRRLKAEHGAALALIDMFQNPTVASLAAMMAAGGTSDTLAETERDEIDARAARARTERRKRALSRKPETGRPT